MNVQISVRAPSGDTGPAREFWEGYGCLDGLRELGILTVDLLPGLSLMGGGGWKERAFTGSNYLSLPRPLCYGDQKALEVQMDFSAPNSHNWLFPAQPRIPPYQEAGLLYMSQDDAPTHQPPGWAEAREEPSSILISYLDTAGWVPATLCWCLLPMAPDLHTLFFLSFGLIWREVSRSGRGRGISVFSAGPVEFSLGGACGSRQMGLTRQQVLFVLTGSQVFEVIISHLAWVEHMHKVLTSIFSSFWNLGNSCIAL